MFPSINDDTSHLQAVAFVLAPYLFEQTAAAAGGDVDSKNHPSNVNDVKNSSISYKAEKNDGDNAVGLSANAFVHGSAGSPDGPKGATTTTATATATTPIAKGKTNSDDAVSSTSAAATSNENMPTTEEHMSSLLRDRDGQEWWEAARPHLFDFVAKYLEMSLVSLGTRLTNAVLVSVAKEGGGGATDAQARSVLICAGFADWLCCRTVLVFFSGWVTLRNG